MGNFMIKLKEIVMLIIAPIKNYTIKNPTIPSEEEFVNYLNSLWNNDLDNIRILNDLPYINEISDEDLKNLQNKVNTNFEKLKIVGNFNYLNQLENEVRLAKNDITLDDLKLTFLALKDLETNNQINNILMGKINKVHICPIIKDSTNNKLNIKNYRFLQLHSKTLKLIDRLWCLKVTDIVKSLDVNIFKSSLFKQMNPSVIITADENTKSRENVVLIDIEKAFDSCDYEVVETLLYRNLYRRSNEETAKKLTSEYMYIIKQRVIYFNNKIINFKKGIPTGLPSSNIIFSLIMDEIINEWFTTNNELFKINKDFLLNIFVDDIYMKIINQSIKDIIVKTLIDIFTKYKFNVNFEKCKADENLKLEFFTNLEETDYYLGIPFTRDVKKYCDLILKKYNSKNNCQCTYNELYDKIKKQDKDKKLIYGYFNYKLKPLMLKDDLLTFIEKTLLKPRVDNLPLEQVNNPPLEQVNNPPLEQVNNPPLEQVNNPPLEEVNNPPLEQVNNLPLEEVNNLPLEEVNNSPLEQVNNLPLEEVNNPPLEQVNNLPLEQVNNLPLEEVNNPPLEQVNNPPLEQVNNPPLEQVNNPPLEQVNNPPLEQVNNS